MNPRNPKSKSPLSSSAEEAREELLHRLHTKRRRGRLLEQIYTLAGELLHFKKTVPKNDSHGFSGGVVGHSLLEEPLGFSRPGTA